MMPSWMRFDLLRKFASTLIDNGNNTFSVRMAVGSSVGTNFQSSHRFDTMQAFEGTITALSPNRSIRVFDG